MVLLMRTLSFCCISHAVDQYCDNASMRQSIMSGSWGIVWSWALSGRGRLNYPRQEGILPERCRFLNNFLRLWSFTRLTTAVNRSWLLHLTIGQSLCLPATTDCLKFTIGVRNREILICYGRRALYLTREKPAEAAAVTSIYWASTL